LRFRALRCWEIEWRITRKVHACGAAGSGKRSLDAFTKQWGRIRSQQKCYWAAIGREPQQSPAVISDFDGRCTDVVIKFLDDHHPFPIQLKWSLAGMPSATWSHGSDVVRQANAMSA